MFRSLLILVGVLLTAFACSSASETDTGGTADAPVDEGSSRSASVDGIDVEATWLTPDVASGDNDLGNYPADQFLFLEVKFNTHSGDLMSIEFPESAEFRQGDSKLEPVAWISGKDDAHHREGLLVVPRQLRDGPVELLLRLNSDHLSLTWDAAPRA